MTKVLFIGSTWAGIYKDIIDGFHNLGGYEVDFIKEVSSTHDPFNIRKEFEYPVSYYTRILRKHWVKTLSRDEYKKKYDVLFVLNGQGLHPIVFELLRGRNSNIKTVNYLFDTNSGVYQFYKFFNLFDKVYTFDRIESVEYKVNHLPIFWTPAETLSKKFDFFGLGAYSEDRYLIFRVINEYADRNQMKAFVKIFATIPYSTKLYQIKQWIRRKLGLEGYIPLEWYSHPMVINEMIAPDKFRSIMSESEIVVDTSPNHQVGLTARFMWALGMGRKIITTNTDVVNYDFYSSDYIYVLSKSEEISDNKHFDDFVKTQYSETPEIRNIIDNYRIDNWIREILK